MKDLENFIPTHSPPHDSHGVRTFEISKTSTPIYPEQTKPVIRGIKITEA